MSSSSKASLSSLRNIGWSLWDPIGLMSEGWTWDDDDGTGFEDEYDSYLINAAAQLRQGKSEADVISYLANVEIHNMGLGERSDTHARAEAVVRAILLERLAWAPSEQSDQP